MANKLLLAVLPLTAALGGCASTGYQCPMPNACNPVHQNYKAAVHDTHWRGWQVSNRGASSAATSDGAAKGSSGAHRETAAQLIAGSPASVRAEAQTSSPSASDSGSDSSSWVFDGSPPGDSDADGGANGNTEDGQATNASAHLALSGQALAPALAPAGGDAVPGPIYTPPTPWRAWLAPYATGGGLSSGSYIWFTTPGRWTYLGKHWLASSHLLPSAGANSAVSASGALAPLMPSALGFSASETATAPGVIPSMTQPKVVTSNGQ